MCPLFLLILIASPHQPDDRHPADSFEAKLKKLGSHEAPGGTTSIAKDHPEIFEQMKSQLEELVKAPRTRP
jgi:hypothetical protein